MKGAIDPFGQESPSANGFTVASGETRTMYRVANQQVFGMGRCISRVIEKETGMATGIHCMSGVGDGTD